VWLWLGQGNQIISTDSQSYVIVKFSETGGLIWSSGNKCTSKFEDYQNWKKHTPPRLIRVGNVVVPAPLDSLDGVDVVYIAVPTSKCKYIEVGIEFINQYSDILDLCYTKKEDAIARAESMRKYKVVE